MTQRGTRKPRLARRGIVVPMVMATIAMAVVLAFAVASSATIKAQLSANALVAGRAQSLAESGVNLATYWLNNPTKYAQPNLSAAATFPFYPSDVGKDAGAGASASWAGLALDNGGNGTVSITITELAPTVSYAASLAAATYVDYAIDATASATSASGSAAAQFVQHAVIRAYRSFYPAAALAAQQDLTLPGVTVAPVSAPPSAFAVETRGNYYGTSGLLGTLLNILTGTSVNGTVKAANMNSLTGTKTTAADDTYFMFDWPDLAWYRGPGIAPQYRYNGNLYTATMLTGSTLNSSYANAATNPLGVVYHAGDLTIGGGANFTGVLIVDGSLNVGTSPSLFFAENYTFSAPATSSSTPWLAPALLVKSQFNIASGNKAAAVNGMAFLGGNVGCLIGGYGSMTFNGPVGFGAAANYIPLQLMPTVRIQTNWTRVAPISGLTAKSNQLVTRLSMIDFEGKFTGP